MRTDSRLAAAPNPEHGTLRSYVTGFILSVTLTVAAYLLVTNHVGPGPVLIGIVIVLALVQFLVQLLFFLHLGKETKPRWKLLVFGLMIVVVAILVLGSLWIMNNLSYHMTPTQINNYLNSQNGF